MGWRNHYYHIPNPPPQCIVEFCHIQLATGLNMIQENTVNFFLSVNDLVDIYLDWANFYSSKELLTKKNLKKFDWLWEKTIVFFFTKTTLLPHLRTKMNCLLEEMMQGNMKKIQLKQNTKIQITSYLVKFNMFHLHGLSSKKPSFQKLISFKCNQVLIYILKHFL